MADEGVQFRFVAFVPSRAFRDKEAARVEVIQAGEQDLLWMSIADLRANIEGFGQHPELEKALEAYGSHHRL